jgi:hypothetical protein
MASPTKDAVVKFASGGTVLGEVASASFALTRQSIDVTALGNGHRHHVAGFMEGTATLELFYNSADHATIMGGFVNGTIVQNVEILWESAKSVKGDALIQDFSMSLAPNGVAQATIVLQFTQNAITVTP